MTEQDDLKPLGELLKDIHEIVGQQPDPERAKQVARTGLRAEIADLSDARADLIDEIQTGRVTPEVGQPALNALNHSLLDAQADKIALDSPQGDAPGQ